MISHGPTPETCQYICLTPFDSPQLSPATSVCVHKLLYFRLKTSVVCCTLPAAYVEPCVALSIMRLSTWLRDTMFGYWDPVARHMWKISCVGATKVRTHPVDQLMQIMRFCSAREQERLQFALPCLVCIGPHFKGFRAGWLPLPVTPAELCARS